MKIKNALKKAAALLVSLSMAVTSTFVTASAAFNTSEFPPDYTYPTQMRGLTAFQIASDMGAGWNLGNSLESENYEEHWGNPKTTKAMIDTIAAKGFTTLRVPVRWDDHYSNASTYTIDSTFMDRVEMVVNYGLANDMYVILNVHHCDLQTKVTTDTSVQNSVKAELAAIWTQVGNHFKNYGDKLIFETNNEPRCGEDWNGNSAYYDCVNQYNEAARTAIRATGGNNTDRLVMMPTYCASADEAKVLGWKKLANDDMIAVSTHAYLPFDFAFEGVVENGTLITGHSDWRQSDYNELKGIIDRLHENFISKGIPVVMGEFGACNKSNTADREKYAAAYIGLARSFAEQDIPCVWWDNNAFNIGAENFGLFNRGSKSFTYGGIADALVNAYKGNPPYEEASAGGQTLFEGSSSCSNWGQAVTLSPTAVTSMSAGDTLYVEYSSSNAPELILQGVSVQGGWCKINPDSANGSVASWSYTTIASASNNSFTGLYNVFIGATFSELTVTKTYTVSGSSAHTHQYDGTEQVLLASTEYTEGKKLVYCSVSGCTAYKTEIVPKSGVHTHNYGTAWKYDETNHWHKCSCGDTTDTAAHTSDGGVVTTSPTTTSTGVKTYSCSVCGRILKTETVDKLTPDHTHSYSSDWKSDANSHWHECGCGDKTDTASHISDSGKITTQPTTSSEGIKTYSCTVCGKVLSTENIPALTPDPTPDPTPNPDDPITAFVERLYVNILNRASDPSKVTHIDNLNNGESACKVAFDFVFSSEFANLPISNEERVKRMYLTFLNREADPAGLADWTSVLDNGCSIGHIFYGFTQSNEFTEICAEYGINRGTWEYTENRDRSSKLTAFVARLYTKAMGRAYDVNGLNDHTGSYLKNRDLYQLAYNFIFSQEFIEKNLSDEDFVNTMYRTFFDREADPVGKADWLGKLKSGMPREEVLAGFVGSQECADLVAKFGI